MNVHDALESAQAVAREMLVEEFDAKRNIPMRAPSHSDLWPGDRWPEAYIAAGEPDLAEAAMTGIADSVRPDGSFPHLRSGSHRRGGLETHWVDRLVYIMEGNGLMHLPNGEWVTRSFASPTQALSVLAMHKAGLAIPEGLDTEALVDSMLTLYDHRGISGGLIATKKRDELTSRAGKYAAKLEHQGAVIDPAVNALLILNNRAIHEYAVLQRQFDIDPDFTEQAADAEDLFLGMFMNGLHGPVSPEEVLAVARIPEAASALKERKLAEFFKAPDEGDDHPERSHLSMAHTLEVARNTLQFEASHEYLQRVLPVIARFGASAITEYEGSAPQGNAVMDKYERKHSWLPTAAEIIKIDASSL